MFTNNCLFLVCWLHFRVTPRMSWYLSPSLSIGRFVSDLSICGFQGTYLTESLSVISKFDSSNPLITGKNQLYGTALPCWSRLTHRHHRCLFHQVLTTNSSIQMCLFYFKTLLRVNFLFNRIRHPPAFPCRLQHSIIGRSGLNHRVRDGNGCVPWAHRHRKFRVVMSKCKTKIRNCVESLLS